MFRHTRFSAFRGGHVNDNNISALKANFDHDLQLAITLLEDELIDVQTKIAELTDRLRRLEQGGVTPAPSA
jgi:hypothetical protein